jgi:hypothetical protein
MAINWTTVFVAAMGSIGTAVVIIVGAAVAWGRVSQQVKDLVARQDSANGKLASKPKTATATLLFRPGARLRSKKMA